VPQKYIYLMCSLVEVVALRKIVNDETKKMKRLPFTCPISLCSETEVTHQVNSCKGMYNTGSRLLTHRRTTTSLGKDTETGLQNGSLRATS